MISISPTTVRRIASNPVLSAALLASIVAFSASAQTTTPTSGFTPSGLTPGSPAGSYALSGFDSINPYNGSMNFSLPLLSVGGRGTAAYVIPVQVEQKWTAFHDVIIDPQTSQQWDFWWPEYNWWTGLKPGYSPGVLQGRQAGVGVQTCTTGGTWSTYFQTLTRLTFTAPDGTEYELRDQLTGGQRATVPLCTPLTTPGASRGTVFVTADGSSATFVSDNTINDSIGIGSYNVIYPSGYLVLRDGTRFRIVDGAVTWMRDRNGNRLTVGPVGGATVITDSLDRQITIEHDVQDIAPYGLCDRITYKGFGGDPRVIRVSKTNLGSALRSGFVRQSPIALFPELFSGSSTLHDPTVISKIWLPNDQNYKLFYNSYGELARVELPTGGAFEYDWAAGATGGPTSGVICPLSNDPQIYRRIVERREYTAGGTGSSYDNRMTFSRPESATSNCPTTNAGYVEVDQYSNSGTLLTRTRHFYFGSPSNSLINVHDPTGYSAWEDGKEHQTEVFAADGTTLLRRVVNTWETGTTLGGLDINPRISAVTTTLNDLNLVAKKTFAYDQCTGCNSYFNNQTDVYEYDFGPGGPGPLVRRTHTDFVTTANYVNFNSDPNQGAHIRSLPLQQWISSDFAGTTRFSRTDYEYDNYNDDPRHKPLVPRTSITGHDAAYSASFTLRGNATGVTSYANASALTGPVTVSTQYDIAGNAVTAIDGMGKTRTLTFSDWFCNGTSCGGTFIPNTYAFATAITSPVPDPSGQHGSTTALVTSSVFDFWTGKVTSTTDANNQTTSVTYNDLLDRPSQTTRAVGTTLVNQTTFSYGDVARTITTTTDLNANNDNLLVSKLFYDGLGRTFETRQYEGGTNYIAVKTQFDALGRPFKTSSPYRPWQSETAIWTITTFDALGRVLTVTTPDSAVVSTSYSGNTVTVTDQNTKKRKSVTDALGRLKEVSEDPLGVNYQTSYLYDVIDNLTTVTQGTQTRTFVYDSLKRLTSAANPESGTISYQYDSNGNLTQKTDARNISIAYAYDALNRNTTVDYSSTTSINPDITRIYDSGTNGKGRLRESYAGGTETVGSLVEHMKIISYDPLGRPQEQRQRFKTNSIWSAEYNTARTYNLAGGVVTQTYPSGRAVTYNYDAAGRLGDKDAQNLAFTGNLGDGITRTYSQGIIYSPLGGMTKEQFGTDTPLYNKSFYNSRGQLSEIRVGTTYTGPTDSSWNRGAIINHYSNSCWGMCGGSNSTTAMTDNNGNLKKQEVYVPLHDQPQPTSYTSWWQGYEYDSLNRLRWVTEEAGDPAKNWKQEYVYDRWGNRTIHQTNTTGLGINKKDFIVNTANNRLGVPGGQSGTMSYDAVGNLTTDTYTGVGDRVYDAENRMTKAWGGNNQWQEYGYNADGQRTRRKLDGVETWQIYGMDGELLAEYPASGATTSPQKEYGYRNGQLLVTAEPARANVALAANGATATASSTLSPYVASNAIDGARRATNNNVWLDNTLASFPDWIEVNFNGSKTISEIDVVTQQDDYQNPIEPTLTQTFSLYGITAFDVQYWNGAAWVNVPGGSVTGNNKVWRQFTFAPITTSKIRVVVNAGADNTYSRVVEVEAWEAPPMNFALAANGATATASSTLSPYVASNAIDGARRATNNNVWLDNTLASFPDWIEVNFNGSKTISEIDVVTQQDNYQNPVEPSLTQTFSLYGITAFDVQYWNGTAWVNVPGGSVTGNNKVWRQFTFAPVTTSKIRVVINAGADNTYSRVVEVEAWNTPSVPSNVNLNWLVADQLGTLRMVFDKTGSFSATKRHDYLPFGEELVAPQGLRTTALGYTADTIRQKFTQKERDNETGLDYFEARYYSSTQGRFTSIDQAAGKTLDPQSLNRYAYVGNNPLNAVDPDGLYPRSQHQYITFMLAAMLGYQNAHAIGKATGNQDSFRNAATLPWNFNKHFGEPESPEDIRQQISRGDFRSDEGIQTLGRKLHLLQDNSPSPLRGPHQIVEGYNPFARALSAAIHGVRDALGFFGVGSSPDKDPNRRGGWAATWLALGGTRDNYPEGALNYILNYVNQHGLTIVGMQYIPSGGSPLTSGMAPPSGAIPVHSTVVDGVRVNIYVIPPEKKKKKPKDSQIEINGTE